MDYYSEACFKVTGTKEQIDLLETKIKDHNENDNNDGIINWYRDSSEELIIDNGFNDHFAYYDEIIPILENWQIECKYDSAVVFTVNSSCSRPGPDDIRSITYLICKGKTETIDAEEIAYGKVVEMCRVQNT